MLKALVVHNQHHQVHAFDADLQTPASSANRNERWRAPASGGAAGGDAASMFATKDEATFNQMGNYQNALRIAQHFFRNAFVRSSHDGVQNIDRRLQAFDRVFASGTCPGKVPNRPIKPINNTDIAFS